MPQCSMLIPPDPQFFDSNGDPLAGGSLEFYAAGFGAPKAVYADGNGITSLGAVVTLDSVGRAKIWLDGYYYVIVKDALGNIIYTEDNVSSAYSPAAAPITMSEWQEQDDVLTYINATSFSVPGDQTLIYTIGRRIKATVTAGTYYGTITNCVAAGAPIVTTITVIGDLAYTLDAGLSAVWTGIISPVLSGTPYQIPIGGVIPWFKSLGGCPALPYGWAECDGSIINDVLSPLNGSTLPNINGSGYFVRGAATSGTIQASQNLAHIHTLTDDGTSPIVHVHKNGDISVSMLGYTIDGSGNPTTIGGAGANGYDGIAAFVNVSDLSPHMSAVSSGGAESRPINISAVFIMRIK